MNERPSGDRSAARLTFSARSVLASGAIVAAVLAAFWVATQSVYVLGWFATAALVAALAHPLVGALSRKLPRPLSLLTVVVGGTALAGAVGWSGIGDVRRAIDRLRGVAPDAAGRIEAFDSWIGRAARDYGLRDKVQIFLDDLPSRLSGGASTEAIRARAGEVLAVLVITVLSIFLVSHGPRLIAGALRQVRNDERRGTVTRAAYRAYVVSWGYLIRLIGKSVVAGMAATVISRLLGLPAASILGVTVAAGSFIPRLGVLIGGLPIMLLAAGFEGIGSASMAVALVVALQVVDTVVMVRVIERRTLSVGPAASVASVFIGAALYGIVGAGIALLVAAMTIAMTPDE